MKSRARRGLIVASIQLVPELRYKRAVDVLFDIGMGFIAFGTVLVLFASVIALGVWLLYHFIVGS